MTTLLLMAVAVAVAALVQGVIGVGFALIVVPLAAVIWPGLLPGSILILMLPLNAFVAWRERHHIEWPSLSWITAGRFAGTFAGLWVLIAVTTQMLNLVIGATTILAAVLTKLSPAFSPNRSAYLGAGFITGVTETATGIGGPPLAIVYQHHSAPQVRANIALCFLIGEMFSIVALIAKDRLGLQQIQDAAMLALPLVVGLLVAGPAHRAIAPDRLRAALLVFAVVSGIVLIVQATQG